MRVGIIGLLQESNTFLSVPTEWEHFQEDIVACGEDVRQRFQGSPHEIGGFFSGLEKEGIEAIPVFVARALPRGTVSKNCWDRLLHEMKKACSQTGKLHGLLVAPHGATVAENAPDADGHWLNLIRNHFGKIPIVATGDPHGNFSPAQAQAVDAIFSYQTNPHLDQLARGLDATRTMVQTLAGKIQPRQAACFLPLAINIASQNTGEEPLKSLMDKAAAMRQQKGILAVSVFLGFPYADVNNMGAAVSVTANGSLELAETLANELAAFWWDRRAAFSPDLLPIPEAVNKINGQAAPVCVCDMGDNVGGGSPGDGTLIVREILQQKVSPAFVCLFDPHTVQLAQKTGIGQSAEFSLGGKTGGLHCPAIKHFFQVTHLSEGKFQESSPTHGGFTSFDQGPTAVLRSREGLTVMATSKRMVPFSLNQLYSQGLDPVDFKAIVVKGVHAPLAAYMKVCKSFVRVNTPGVTTADLNQLTYLRRRRPMYPFEPETKWHPGIATMPG